MSEDAFRKAVEKAFKEKIPIGTNEKDKKLFLVYDLGAVFYDVDKWKVDSILFTVEDDKRNLLTVWRQPTIEINDKKFAPKMVKWIIKNFKLPNFDNDKISKEILKRIETVEKGQ